MTLELELKRCSYLVLNKRAPPSLLNVVRRFLRLSWMRVFFSSLLSHCQIVFSSDRFGSCVHHVAETTNCYLPPTTVFARHYTGVSQASVGDLYACVYKYGTCILRDGSVS